MTKTEVCLFCDRKQKRLTLHHILPRRFYGENPFTVPICRDCHNFIETLIPREKVLPTIEYFYIVWAFYRYKDEARLYLEHRKKTISQLLNFTS